MAAADFDEDEYRQDVAAFLRESWTDRPGGRPDEDTFRKEAVARGYLWRSIPKAYGGSEQQPDAIKGLIIKEEFAKARAPKEYPNRAVPLIVGTLLAAGEDWQKEMFVPKTLTGEYFWCQGYSEPGAGSDVASLRTKAVLEDSQWVINGQKVWTSFAPKATHMFLMARTEPDAPKHAGISYFLMDMKQPGVTVRPLMQITGDSEFCEVFLDDAKTPETWIVGKRGEGWAVSRKTLVFERTSIGSADVSEGLFKKLLSLAKSTNLNGAPAIQDPVIRDDIARLQGMVAAHKAHDMDGLYYLRRGEESSPARGAFTKLYNSTIAERIALVAQKIMNDVAIASPTADAPGPARWLNQYMNSIAAQIGGGTSNIQRNIIAERALGLPRDDLAS